MRMRDVTLNLIGPAKCRTNKILGNINQCHDEPFINVMHQLRQTHLQFI